MPRDHHKDNNNSVALRRGSKHRRRGHRAALTRASTSPTRSKVSGDLKRWKKWTKKAGSYYVLFAAGFAGADLTRDLSNISTTPVRVADSHRASHTPRPTRPKLGQGTPAPVQATRRRGSPRACSVVGSTHGVLASRMTLLATRIHQWQGAIQRRIGLTTMICAWTTMPERTRCRWGSSSIGIRRSGISGMLLAMSKGGRRREVVRIRRVAASGAGVDCVALVGRRVHVAGEKTVAAISRSVYI